MNSNNDASIQNLFSASTDIISSSGNDLLGTWKVSCNLIPGYKYNFTSRDITKLRNRPRFGDDFASSSLLVRAGQVSVFGSDIGFSSSSCSNGFWPPIVSVCPYPKSTTISFPLRPKPEISSSMNELFLGIEMINVWNVFQEVVG